MRVAWLAVVWVGWLLGGCESDGGGAWGAGGAGGGGAGGGGDAGADAGEVDGSVASDVCVRQRAGQTEDGEPVVVCEQAHPARPFVRPPPDEAQRFIAGFLPYGGPRDDQPAFVTRDGTEHVLLDGDGQLKSLGETAFQFAARVLPAMRMPSNRNLYLLYEVRGTTRQVDVDGTPSPALVVDAVAPSILLSAEVLDGTHRAWEGELAPPTGDFANAYDWDRAVPFRFEIERLDPVGPPFPDGTPVWDDPAAALADGPLLRARGVVTNATAGRRSADGACLPALDDGAFDPLAAVPDARFDLLRFPGMHAPGDQVFTLAPVDAGAADYPEGMAPIQVTHPAAFLLATPDDAWTTVEFAPHGFPHNVAARMHPVTGGGDPCDPD